MALKTEERYAVVMADIKNGNSYDDPENAAWEARFGKPYVEDDYSAREFDEAALERLEEEFRAAGEDRKSPFGTLEQLDDED